MNALKLSRPTQRSLILFVGVGVVALWVGEGTARRQLERRYQHARESQRQLELQLGALQADRARLSEALDAERQHVTQLSTTLAEKDTRLQETVNRLSQEERLIQELQDKLLAMERQMNLLQGELAMSLQTLSTAPEGHHDVVQLEKIVVREPTGGNAGLQGRVLSINPDWRFVVMDLGWDVVKIGDIVSIYRNDQLLGKARIERVQERVSAATLLPEWSRIDIQVNDVVRIL